MMASLEVFAVGGGIGRQYAQKLMLLATRRAIFIIIIYLFSPNEQCGGWGGGGYAARLFFLLFSLFSRPRAGLATVGSSFFGLATNTLNVRNNNNNNNSKNVPTHICSQCQRTRLTIVAELSTKRERQLQIS